jgi:hypothetical protein
MAKPGRRPTGEVIETRPGAWKIRWRENGARRSASNLPSRDAAERLLAKVLGEVAQGIPAVPRFSAPLVAAPVEVASRDIPAPLADLTPVLREASFGMEDGPGIYFLLRSGVVAYVGKSEQVRTRLGQHMGCYGFDRALWLACGSDDLATAERCLIALLQPPLNRDTFDLTPARLAWLERLGVRRSAA